MRIPETCPKVMNDLDSGTVCVSPEVLAYAKECNSRYLHWDDLRNRDFGGHDRYEVWKIMKVLRTLTYHDVDIMDLSLTYSMMDDLVRDSLHEIDFRLLPDSLGVRRDRERSMLSVSSVMEESIASSQLEGASTTRELAKRMLRSNQIPKDRSQRMIANNYAAMQVIRERIDEPLTPGLIKDIHMTIVDGLMDNPSSAGEFRKDDSVAIRSVYEDITYHVPVGHEKIDDMIDSLCTFANQRTGGHPIVKAIVLHYALAYIHPFLDGNGRVSRSLFYWYCMKNGYPMVQYLSISKVIRKHRQGYDLAYLYSETDDNDITYFIRYNLKAILESIGLFESYLKKRTKELKDAAESFTDFGLSARQTQILKDMKDAGRPLSLYELSTKYQTPVPTVRRDVVALIDAGLAVPSSKDGHRQLYGYRKDRI